MNLKNILWVAGGIALAAVIAIVFYGIGKNSVPESDENLRAEVEELRSTEEDAVVTKRVSQQMEDIAYQQKAMSDQQRERAEKQSQIANDMRLRAEQESRLAQKAEEQARTSAHQAELAAKEAEHQRANAIGQQKIAEEQRDEATRAKSISDTLSYRTLGKTLGASSLATFAGKQEELSALLAYAGYYFINKYNGNVYQPEVFKALVESSSSQTTKKMPQGGGVTAMCKLANGECVAVSNYGEVNYCGSQKVIFYNNDYDFRDVIATDDILYVLSFNGVICEIPLNGRISSKQAQNFSVRTLPHGGFTKMIRANEDVLLLAGKKELCWYQLKSKRSTLIPLSKNLSTIMKNGKKYCLFYADGSYGEFDETGKVTMKKPIINKIVTAIYDDPSHKTLYLGCSDGQIAIIKNNKFQQYLYGHAQRITAMMRIGEVLISGSYDKNAAVWNLQKLYGTENAKTKDDNSALKEWLTPAEYQYNGWPLCLCQAGANEAYIGTSNGLVQRVNISASGMAAKIKSNMKRNLTREEWNQYVNSSVPYVKFK